MHKTDEGATPSARTMVVSYDDVLAIVMGNLTGIKGRVPNCTPLPHVRLQFGTHCGRRGATTSGRGRPAWLIRRLRRDTTRHLMQLPTMTNELREHRTLFRMRLLPLPPFAFISIFDSFHCRYHLYQTYLGQLLSCICLHLQPCLRTRTRNSEEERRASSRVPRKIDFRKYILACNGSIRSSTSTRASSPGTDPTPGERERNLSECNFVARNGNLQHEQESPIPASNPDPSPIERLLERSRRTIRR